VGRAGAAPGAGRGSEPADGAPSAAAWAGLDAALGGRLVRPGDPDYRRACRLYDYRFDAVHPQGVAYCADDDDVARSLAFAREHGLTPRPRSGGHSYAGYSTGPGLVVDVSRLSGVVTGPGSAAVGAGARLIDVYSALARAGRSVPAGSCPTVGIAGIALGGGIGVMTRSEGLTSDRITSLRLVSADSRVLEVSAADNPELYWACRGGGGGNFGVVTSFELTTFPTAEVCVFFLTWPWSAAAEVLSAWQPWAAGAPEAVWSNCLLEAVPSRAAATVSVGGVSRLSVASTDAVLADLVGALGPPSSRSVAASDFASAMFVEAGCAGLSEAACHLRSETPGGVLARAPGLASSELLTTPLVEPAVELLVEAVASRQDEGRPAAAGFDALGGVASRPSPDATAWVHRDALWSAQLSTALRKGEPVAEVARSRAWLDEVRSRLRPYVSGQAYQNYIDPTLSDWEQAYYGANLPRLEQVRRRYDPDGVFRFAQVIPRAGG